MEELELLKQARATEEHKLSLMRELTSEREEEIKAGYRAEVESLLAQLEEEERAARELAREADADPTGWLSSKELEHAQQRAPFLREELDAGELSTEQLMSRMRQAIAGDDRPAAWLLWRYGPGLEDISDPSLSIRAEYRRMRQELENYVVPASVREAETKSHQRLLDVARKRAVLREELWKLNGRTGHYNPF